MKSVLNIKTIRDYNVLVGQETLHPLVSVIDFSKIKSYKQPAVQTLNFSFYAVFLKDNEHCEIRYGRNNYDYQEGTLIFIAPGQVVSIEDDGEDYQPSGYALLFHPDLIRGTLLGQHMNDYTFFSYDVHEALHLAESERQVVMECFNKINYEFKQMIDKHSKKLILSNIELFLNYCVRFYDRQFITRDHANTGVLEKFEGLVDEYFSSDKPQETGIPSVSYFASTLHLSPNYFGDLVKKETGKTAQEYIQAKLIDVAKEKIFDPAKSVSEIAYELGFNYPQHFTRLFKKKVGVSPKEYRRSVN
ncbi:helix-turn-helix domain-containing protein [Flavihumibacter fluvii]|uniref:helix-turn-helix domain-containing protein n=1 Tax=Flavihumibacter fluvii TaxID=2838157 RepID=UPI001BDDECF7|nr:AraC family transcriptional regulator [Flavihumibacter fluvii]ULQ50768.1 AraC family transcriptional regulator [Flavihumibacter fluvii]